ncbi:MAG: hypothetical protein IPI59_09000 [Sphingobacteriales bacterium]|jgi:hypothetical protein|nr:hypothetical protein [Sphingobacteriales bacterium]MBP9141565.1 hypothetical protein [Chitinophagales bacterium]MDA0198668.1 hypothetical protein [Bacteroidota bacterium]MBK6889812.1 hypothetical protein [Sphingobacteriales bacterium]MBK7527670.1 hypothetical protein [Sphingobacteriales bacterium]
MDNNANNPALVNDPIVNENLQGYTMQACLNAISDGCPTTMEEFRANMEASLPAGQNTTDLDNIFNQYAW